MPQSVPSQNINGSGDRVATVVAAAADGSGRSGMSSRVAGLGQVGHQVILNLFSCCCCLNTVVPHHIDGCIDAWHGRRERVARSLLTDMQDVRRVRVEATEIVPTSLEPHPFCMAMTETVSVSCSCCGRSRFDGKLKQLDRGDRGPSRAWIPIA